MNFFSRDILNTTSLKEDLGHEILTQMTNASHINCARVRDRREDWDYVEAVIIDVEGNQLPISFLKKETLLKLEEFITRSIDADDTSFYTHRLYLDSMTLIDIEDDELDDDLEI